MADLGWCWLTGGLPFGVFRVLTSLYISVFLLLAGMIFRGIAFEFRFKAEPGKKCAWNVALCGGSLAATFAQGTVVGTYIQGFKTGNFRYVGGTFDWLMPFTVMTGFGMIVCCALIGAT